MIIYMLGKPRSQAEREEIYMAEEIIFIDSVEEYARLKNQEKTMNPFADLINPTPASTAHTLKEWNARGYRVRYGETSTGRNADGVATFTEDQVHLEEDAEDSYEGFDDFIPPFAGY